MDADNVKNYNTVGKYQVFADILNTYFENANITVLEYGRLRNLKERARHTDGWSTLELSKHPSVQTLYSLDTNTQTVELCQEIIPEAMQPKVYYAESIDEFELEESSVDLLFLDADNDPEQCVELYEQAEPYLKSGAFILIDDVFDTKGKKGDLLLPKLKSNHSIKNYHPFALAIPN